MKCKHTKFTWFCAAAVALWSCGLSAPVHADEIIGKFHPAETAAEKALEKVLRRPEPYYKNPDLAAVEKYLKTDKIFDFPDADLFTKPYLRAWAKAQRKLLYDFCDSLEEDNEYRNCDHYIGLSCIRDRVSSYNYLTLQVSESIAYVASAWPRSDRADVVYKLVKKSGRWRLDGGGCWSPPYNIDPVEFQRVRRNYHSSNR